MAYSIRFNSGPTFTFLAMVTPNGAPLSVARIIEEVLETPGVNGHRWRTVARQHRAFPLRAIAAANDFAAAEALQNAYLTALLGSQTVTLTDDDTALAGMHVSDVDPIALPGQIVGAGAGSSSLASVSSTWLMEYTFFARGS